MKPYPIHPRYSALEKLDAPMHSALLPLCNAFLRLPISRRYRGIRRTKKRADGVPVSIYSPKDLKGDAPCLVYFHGGGFALRAAPQHYKLAQVYCEEARCRVVLVDYSVRPFPAPVLDCFAAYRWVVKNAHRLAIDPKRIAVGGDSAGGALAAACCLMARDKRIPLPCFQLLVYPVTDRRMQTPSMAAFPDTPMWNAKKNAVMWRRYLSRPHDLPMEYASPMEAESFSGLPDAYVEVAEFDCLRDEGVAYAMALQKGGAKVEMNMTAGTVHGFELAWKAEPTQMAIDRRVHALRKALG